MFGVAFLLRAGAVLAFPTATVAGHQVIFGAPIADAWHWYQVAAATARGEGVNTSLRPLYSLLLALPFQYLGASLAIAKIVNALLDSVSILLGYLIFKRLLPAPAPLIVSLSLAVLPNYIMFSHGLLTEHAGATFLLAALAVLLAERWTAAVWAMAGLLTGLSNLARPMTLFAVPLLAVVSLAYERSRAVILLAAFTVSVGITLAPWMMTQYQRHGILSLSSNTNQVLYAATSPKYGTWSPAVEHDRLAEGFSATSSIAEWDALFRHGTSRNLRDFPLFWPKNIAVNMWESVNDGGLWLQQPPALTVALALLWTACGAIYAWRTPNPIRRPSVLALVVCATLVLAAVLTKLWVFFLAAGAAFAVQHAQRATIVVATYLLGCMLGHALFGFSSTYDRLGLMYAPIVFGLQAAGWVGLGAGIVWLTLSRLAPLEWSGTAIPSSQAVPRQRQWLVAAVASAVIVVAFSSARLAALNLWTSPRPNELSSFEFEKERADSLKALETVRLSLEAARDDPPRRLVIDDGIFPMSYIPVPDALASTLDTREPMAVFYLAFSRIGARWSIVPQRNVQALLGKRFVALLEEPPDPNRADTPLRYVGPLTRVRALAPIVHGGSTLAGLVVAE
ncbi:hypothetical protein [Bradyrhizobium sp. LHD-71]|uniref:hypothetical protein n=1 Tax=Bradyrhizobium sp. LHD-71 TaxID=3072141 RepID=UPI0028104FE9|nr:hypothetical protein [Bradyrhizobium sp. LHD-71]MDQ8727193.1 hypothetical protein [Bradyrhizobium sp. LHD-71]